ncbi:Ras-related protein Rab-11B [Hondaea fermentalgiana]|uniref:Ras-related protein Rab-11B n=1 Tax=Hondaea fermentalgiana TaxID=2315210 RepID=A0A2R5GHD0_9STRA|nr:Ras-related protein Rab-11B [Hondaea fermentalgiana]|eukprot:GBG30317.1 Ras-related protein Rab-11B [Hondaea fermentalgiana]
MLRVDNGTHVYKIVLIGNSAVGKTNLLASFMREQKLEKRRRSAGGSRGQDAELRDAEEETGPASRLEKGFSDAHPPTIGCEFYSEHITHPTDGAKIQLQIWDTAGQERYRSITPGHYRRAVGCLLVYDVTNRRSFEALESWHKELLDWPLHECIMLVGNKMDLYEPGNPDHVSPEEHQKAQLRFMFRACVRTSAKTGENVNNCFLKLVFLIHERETSSAGHSAGDAGAYDARSSLNYLKSSIALDDAEGDPDANAQQESPCGAELAAYKDAEPDLILRGQASPGCKQLEGLGVVELAQSAQGALRELDVSHCDSVDDSILEQFAMQTPRLRVLRVQKCRHITDNGILSLSVGGVDALEIVDVSGTQVTDIGLSALNESFAHSLCELYASMPRPVNVVRDEKLLTAGMGALSRLSYSKDEQKAMLQVRKLAELKQSRRGQWIARNEAGSRFRVLHVANHSFLRAERLFALCMASADTLVELCVHGVATLTPAHLRETLSVCSRLTNLDISCCAQLGEEAASVLCEMGQALWELALSRAPDEQEPAPLSNEALVRILVECRDLRILHARHQTAFTFASDDGQQLLQRIEQLRTRGTSLQELDLSGGLALKQASLIQLTRVFGNLQKLNISYCPQIPMSAVRAACRPDLTICEKPFFGLITDKVRQRNLQVSRAWCLREKREDVAVRKIQNRYRAYKSAPVSIEYLIFCNPRLSEKCAIMIQRQWRHHRMVSRLLAAAHRIWAIRVLQRMFRGIFRYVASAPNEGVPNLSLGGVQIPLRETFIALGEARDFLQRREEVMRELRVRFAVLRAKEAEIRRRERHFERTKLERAAVLVQRTYRRRVSSRDLATAAALALKRKEELEGREKVANICKLQAWARGHAPRRAYQECKLGPLRKYVDPRRQQEAAASIYRPVFRKLARYKALGRRANLRHQFDQFLRENKAFSDEVLQPALGRARARMADAQSVLQSANMAAKEAARQERSKMVAAIAMASRDHARQSFATLDSLIRLIETNMGEAEERRIAQAVAVHNFCEEKTQTLLRQTARLESIKDRLLARRSLVVQHLRDHIPVHKLFDCYEDPKLHALSRTKKEIAARHEVDWIDVQLGERTIGDVLAERRIEEGTASAGGVNREALAARADHNVPAEIARYWEEINLVADFEVSFLRSLVKFEEKRCARLRRILPLNAYLMCYVDEARNMAIARARSDHTEDFTQSLRLVKQETPIRYKIMHLQDEMKAPAVDLATDLRAWEVQMQAVALPRATSGFLVTLPGTCHVTHKVSVKSLEREMKSAAWTSLLPGRFFADLAALEADRALQNRIQASLNARQQENDVEAQGDGESKGGDDDNDDDDDDDASFAGMVPSGPVAGLLRDARLRARADGTLVQKFRNWWNQDKHELEAIEQSVLRRQRTGASVFQAIAADLTITVGVKDAEEMVKEQTLRREQGLPELHQYSKNLGRDVPIYLWYRTTMMTNEMLTGLKLSHASPRSELYVRDTFGWTRVTHPMMDGSPRTPALQLLYRRGRDELGEEKDQEDEAQEESYIKAIRVSVSAEDEAQFEEEGFERVGEQLSAYFLVADASMWVLWASPGDQSKALLESEQREILEKEDLDKKREALKELIKKHPDKKAKYQKLLHEVDGKLRRLKKLEDHEHKMMVPNATEFLALTKTELGKLVRTFALMDADGSGSISQEELLNFIGIEPSDLTRRVFNFLDDNHDGSIDFPEYMNILSTFCMFGNSDVTRMCFSFLGPSEGKRAPVIAAERFLSQAHGVDIEEVPLLKAASNYMRQCALGDGAIHLDDFFVMSSRYPLAIYPVMQIRDAMREKFLGTRWWTLKLQRYAKARKRLEIRQRKALLKAIDERKKELLPPLVRSSSSVSSERSSSSSSILSELLPSIEERK